MDEGQREAGPESHTPFVGRQEEMALLRKGIQAAIAGQTSLFLVSGEAGMGKSRLTEEAVASARSHGIRVLTGRCWETVDTPPYWPWVQVLRRLCSDMDDSVLRDVEGIAEIAHLVPQVSDRLGVDPSSRSASTDHRFALFDAVASFVRSAAETHTTMLVLEDLHAGDESSLLMLQALSRQERNAGLVVIATYDDDAARGKPGHQRILAEIAREGRQIRLRGLDEAEVSQLYEVVSGQLPSEPIARAVHEASEGNPLFVDEAIRMLTTKGDLRRPDYSVGFRVPEGVREIIRRRLDGLSDEVLELLSVGSVIGREFGLDMLQKVVDIELDPLLDMLAEAVAAEIVFETSALGRYAFSHILIRETLYEDLSAGKRMRLHRTVADTLEESCQAAGEARVPELAHHWFKAAQAGDAAKTMTYAIRAAEQAESQYAYEEAVRLYQRALKVSLAAGADQETMDKIRSGLGATRSATEPSAAPTAVVSSGVFAREGDYWTIAYAGEETRLKDVKGLRYIAQLLKAPGREIHVLELASLVEGTPSAVGKGGGARAEDLSSEGLGDAGEILDPQAKVAYKRRLEDLRHDVEEARDFNDPERAARAQQEIEALVDQLAAGVGLGGRDRRAASQAEKARVNITKSVKDALKRIDENHGPLSQHLRAAIRTGAYCAYAPDPRLHIAWKT